MCHLESSKPQNDSVVGASTVLKMDAQSKHSDIETELSTTEDELDSDDDDAVSVVDSQDSRGRRHQIKYTPRPMKKTLKQRTEMASKRLAVQAKYAKLVEDRLADVEKRLKEVENQRSKKIEVEDETEADPASSESRVPSPTPEPKKRYTQVLGINRVGFEHYKPKKSLDPKPEYLPDGGHRFGPTPVPDLPQRHVIDVVIPHTSIGEAPQSNTGIRPSVFLTAAGVSHEDAAAEGLALPDMQSVVPERIRINSSLLLDVLEYVTGCKFTRLDIDGHEGELKTQAFLRPFKMLVTYEHEIRKHVRDLEEKLALLHAKASTPISTVEANRELSPELIATEKAGSDPEGASGSKNPRSEVLAARSSEDSTTAAEGNIEEFERRLQELHALVEVIDIDLKPVFDLRRRIQEVEIRSISFGDLWHLFRIGKEVRTNQGGTSQVYRIVDISGGRPALCTRADATFGPLEPGIEANDHTIFTISCFCYGFNGRHLGPIQRIFDIQKYDDPKPITSLPVYPVEFSGIEDGDLTREDFVLRGKKFVQLTRDESSVVHKRYHGLSMNLEQLREEVREWIDL